jgi:nicotinamide-nucleotide amidase
MAAKLLALARSNRLTIVTAESCTAGLMGQVMADAIGAAAHYHGSFVTYTKAQKARALGVPPRLLRECGAVGREVARAMAEGALGRSRADLSVAITGVAGPEPDEDGNPVGRVCLAVAGRGRPTRDFERNYGDLGRRQVRLHAVTDALAALIEAARQVDAQR